MTYILLRHRDIENIDQLDVYMKNGGFEAFKKVVTIMKPEEVVEEVIHVSDVDALFDINDL